MGVIVSSSVVDAQRSPAAGGEWSGGIDRPAGARGVRPSGGLCLLGGCKERRGGAVGERPRAGQTEMDCPCC